jgi:hypothetical protein
MVNDAKSNLHTIPFPSPVVQEDASYLHGILISNFNFPLRFFEPWKFSIFLLPKSNKRSIIWLPLNISHNSLEISLNPSFPLIDRNNNNNGSWFL